MEPASTAAGDGLEQLYERLGQPRPYFGDINDLFLYKLLYTAEAPIETMVYRRTANKGVLVE